jgi:alpha/beta superfamily hydrolase
VEDLIDVIRYWEEERKFKVKWLIGHSRGANILFELASSLSDMQMSAIAPNLGCLVCLAARAVMKDGPISHIGRENVTSLLADQVMSIHGGE